MNSNLFEIIPALFGIKEGEKLKFNFSSSEIKSVLSYFNEDLFSVIESEEEKNCIVVRKSNEKMKLSKFIEEKLSNYDGTEIKIKKSVNYLKKFVSDFNKNKGTSFKVLEKENNCVIFSDDYMDISRLTGDQYESMEQKFNGILRVLKSKVVWSPMPDKVKNILKSEEESSPFESGDKRTLDKFQAEIDDLI